MCGYDGLFPISYGQSFADEEPVKTDIHDIKFTKGAVFTITSKDDTIARYQIEKVEDMVG